MKRSFRLCALVLCALLTAALPAGAGEEAGDRDYLKKEFEEGLYRLPAGGAVEAEGRLLFVSGSQLVALELETGLSRSQPLPLPAGGEEPGALGLALLEGGGGLRLLDADRGLLYPLKLEGDALRLSQPLALDWDDYLDRYRSSFPDPDEAPLSYVLTEDSLWVMQMDLRFEAGPYYFITHFDLKDGRAQLPEIPSAAAVTAWKEGQLLMVTPSSFEGDAFRPGKLASFDPDTMALRELREMPEDRFPTDMAYDEGSDTLYIAYGSALYRCDGPKLREAPCASLPHQFTRPGSLRALEDGRVCLAHLGGLSLRKTDPQRFARLPVLRLRGNLYPPLSAAFDSLPGLAASRLQSSLSLPELLLTDAGSFDIGIAEPMAGERFDAVMKKGHALELSGSGALEAFAEGLYPSLREALTMEGRLWGLPVGFYAPCAGYDAAFFDKIGQEPPRDFLSLVDFAAAWQENYSDSFPDRSPISLDSPRFRLIRQALELYQNGELFAGRPLSWDSEALRRLLSAVDGLKLEASSLDPWDENFPRPVISLDSAIQSARDLGGYWEGYLPLLLSGESGQEPVLAIRAAILFINASGSHGEEALRLLEAAAENIDPGLRALLSPGENGPVPNPLYARALRDRERKLSLLRAAAQAAEGAEQRELLAQAENSQKELDGFRQTGRWTADERQIARYRALAKNSIVNRGIDLMALDEPIRRYADQQIGMEQFIAEIEAKTRLMLGEEK